MVFGVVIKWVFDILIFLERGLFYFCMFEGSNLFVFYGFICFLLGLGENKFFVWGMGRERAEKLVFLG